MKKIKLILFLIQVILVSYVVTSATIQGTVYDFSLDEQDNAIVTISTDPIQVYIAKDSYYRFDVPNGDYTLSAKFTLREQLISSYSENISISDDGDYRIDIILFPNLDNDFELDDFVDFDEYEDDQSTKLSVNKSVDSQKELIIFIIAASLIFVLLIVFIYYFLSIRKNLKKDGMNLRKRRIKIKDSCLKVNLSNAASDEIDSDSQFILNILSKNGGRILQKELRKQIPLSEAKISLLISDLESTGKIKKIKKGRGNIIIIK